MTAYEELLEFGGERIFDFLKNARLHESQFKYSEFNEVCYKKMYIENNQDSIKTVKELKEEIPELKDTYTVAIVIVSRFGMRYILRVYFRQRISMLELLVEKTREKTLLNSFLDELQNMYIIIRSGMSIKLMSLQEISILILMI